MAADALMRARRDVHAARVDALATTNVAASPLVSVDDAEATAKAAKDAQAAALDAVKAVETALYKAEAEHAARDAIFSEALHADNAARAAAKHMDAVDTIIPPSDHPDAQEARTALTTARQLANAHATSTAARLADAKCALYAAADAVDAATAANAGDGVARTRLVAAVADATAADAALRATRAIVRSREIVRERAATCAAALAAFDKAAGALRGLCVDADAAADAAAVDAAVAAAVDAALDAVVKQEAITWTTPRLLGNATAAATAVADAAAAATNSATNSATNAPTRGVKRGRSASPASCDAPPMKLRERQPTRASAAGAAIRALYALYVVPSDAAAADSDDEFASNSVATRAVLAQVVRSGEIEDGVEAALGRLAGVALKGNFGTRYVSRAVNENGDAWALTMDGLRVAAGWACTGMQSA